MIKQTPVAARRPMVSADSHVNEPRDLWREALPPSMRSSAMHGISAGADGGWDLILDGRHMAVDAEDEADRLAVLDPDRRTAVLRSEGIAGECIFPTIGLYVWMLEDPEGGRVSCRIYNDWIVDQLESRSNRFRCAGLVPTWTVEGAIAEVEHIAEIGLASVMLPAVAPTSYNRREWEPLWDAIDATGLPIVIHQGTGHDMIWYRGPGATVANLLSTQSIGPRTAALFATSGVLERHPRMHVVFVEYNASWLAWMMDTIDYYNEAFQGLTTATQGSAKLAGERTGPPKPVIHPDLAEPPSAYIRRQVHATFQDDRVALRNVEITGSDCLLWGSDYPHNEGTYPHTRQVVQRLSALVDDDDARMIFGDTAARLFDFDPDIFATPI
jgi:predicted TIM-barrel fold metal-dependent hydrolase